MDLSSTAVPHAVTHLVKLLPPKPARIVEAGCGRGALAAALADLGYQVTGIDHNAEMAAAARDRGVPVIEDDITNVSGQYDVVLFTRSLHHAQNLDDILTHAVTLLAPDGELLIEEFAWERVNQAAASFLYDNQAMLVAAGLLHAEQSPADPLAAWTAGHQALHPGAAMLAALSRLGTDLRTMDTSILWRLVDGRGCQWTQPSTRAADVLKAMRDAEERHIAAGTLPSVGLLASVRP